MSPISIHLAHVLCSALSGALAIPSLLTKYANFSLSVTQPGDEPCITTNRETTIIHVYMVLWRQLCNRVLLKTSKQELIKYDEHPEK